MSDIAIKVDGLSKRYRIGQRERYYTLRDSLTQAFASPFRRLFRREPENRRTGDTGPIPVYPTPRFSDSPNPGHPVSPIPRSPVSQENDTIWALKDVSFSVAHGEVVGIIGRNGAGKSTLLKILSRITEPTEGCAEIHGRVGSLLEVGTGFHPELTGHENIYLNGAILGMRKAEIRSKFDEIVAFAEVEKFIDTPVKHYSSGMHVRLAFAVAAQFDPEILMVDEVLAVGDAEFQKKCLGKMGDVAKAGRTVLFVSHNMAAVNRLCGRGVWLDSGRLQMIGPAESVVAAYISAGSEKGGEYRWPEREKAPDTDAIRLHSVRICTDSGSVTDTINIRLGFAIEVEYEILSTLPPMRIVARVTTADGITVFLARDNYDNGWEERPRPVGFYVSRCRVPGDLLNAGYYTLTISGEIPFVEMLFFEEHILRFRIERTGGMGAQHSEPWPGVICPSLRWQVTTTEGAADHARLRQGGEIHG